MKKWALITGASQGIGYEFAKILAREGHNVVLLARNGTRLEEVATELRGQSGIATKVLVKDLSLINSAREIFDELQREEIPISVLINNAGFGISGSFADVELQRHLDLIQVDVTTLVQLTHLFLPPMLKRNEGRILNVASIAAFLPGPFIQMYYASKAFVHSFSLALAMELRGTRVTVTCLYPGLTTSQFHARAGLMRPETYLTMRADVVADIGYRAMMAGKSGIVSGWKNKLIVGCMKLLPARWAVYMGSRANRRAMKNTVGLQ